MIKQNDASKCSIKIRKNLYEKCKISVGDGHKQRQLCYNKQ